VHKHFAANFLIGIPGTSMTALRLELAKEDAVKAVDGSPAPHETSAGSFLQIGLDLEEQQYADHLSSLLLLII
jgi:hypothetical protein